MPLLLALEVDRVVLIGRDESALRALRAFAQPQAHAEIRVSTEPERALAGASTVLCQARIGGWEGRASDEAGAGRWGAYGDETLGIGGLRAALRAKSTIERWARAANGLPAVVFTNPTDLLTRLWQSHSGALTISACEIPAQLLERLPARTSYIGVNHFGFAVTPSGAAHPSPGVAVAQHLSRRVRMQRERPPRRAQVVATLTTQLRAAIASRDDAAVARVLAARNPRWHELLIRPLLEGLMGDRQFRGVIGLPNGARLRGVDPGVIVESISSLIGPEAYQRRTPVLDAVAIAARARQRAWVCLRDPSPTALAHYLEADPFTSGVKASDGLLAWLIATGR